MSQEARRNYVSNVHILSCIIEVIMFCAKQNIVLRGHHDDLSSTATNKGNFLAVLHLLAKYDATIQQHLDCGRRNAHYSSE